MSDLLRKPNKLTNNQYRDLFAYRGRNSESHPWRTWSEEMAAKKLARCKKRSSCDAVDKDHMTSSFSRDLSNEKHSEYRNIENDQARIE